MSSRMPRTKFQRGELASALAYAIEKNAPPNTLIKEMASAITLALSAPAEMLKPRIEYIYDLIDKANGVTATCICCKKPIDGSTYFSDGLGKRWHVYCQGSHPAIGKLVRA